MIEHLDPADWKFRDAPGYTLHRIGRRGDGNLSIDYTDNCGLWITTTRWDDGRWEPDHEYGLDLIPVPKPVEWGATYRDKRGQIDRTLWSFYRSNVEEDLANYGGTLIELWARMSDGTLRRFYPEGKA
jgi:hypothetical protein